PPICSDHALRLGPVSALICKISTSNFLNSSRFARNPVTWFSQPPVNAKGRKATTVFFPLRSLSLCSVPRCDLSEKSGAGVPGVRAAMGVSFWEWNSRLLWRGNPGGRLGSAPRSPTQELRRIDEPDRRDGSHSRAL